MTLLLLTGPAQACRLHSIWHFHFKQRCPAHAVRYVARVEPPARPHRIATLLERIDVTIPLPALNNIDWGKPADEQTIGRVLIRVKLEGLR